MKSVLGSLRLGAGKCWLHGDVWRGPPAPDFRLGRPWGALWRGRPEAARACLCSGKASRLAPGRRCRPVALAKAGRCQSLEFSAGQHRIQPRKPTPHGAACEGPDVTVSRRSEHGSPPGRARPGLRGTERALAPPARPRPVIQSHTSRPLRAGCCPSRSPWHGHVGTVRVRMLGAEAQTPEATSPEAGAGALPWLILASSLLHLSSPEVAARGRGRKGCTPPSSLLDDGPPRGGAACRGARQARRRAELASDGAGGLEAECPGPGRLRPPRTPGGPGRGGAGARVRGAVCGARVWRVPRAEATGAFRVRSLWHPRPAGAVRLDVPPEAALTPVPSSRRHATRLITRHTPDAPPPRDVPQS